MTVYTYTSLLVGESVHYFYYAKSKCANNNNKNGKNSKDKNNSPANEEKPVSVFVFSKRR